MHFPGDGLKDFFRKAGDFFAGLFNRISTGLKNIPREKRYHVLMISIASVALLLLVLGGVSLLSGRKTPEQELSYRADILQSRNSIPPDELFFPDEPDFVPGVLLEREKRMAWTVNDAAPWWQDPLRSGEQVWRDQIEKTIDEIMESVP